MKRLLLDTNIYGELVLDADFEALKRSILLHCVVHGFRVIRDELRDVPKDNMIGGKSLRLSLLHIYDEFTKKSYPLTDDIRQLGELYFKEYRNLGGSKAPEKMIPDLWIVACATMNQIDIVVSEDNKSMLTENALKAYDTVNTVHQKKTPNFIGYLELKRWLLE